MDYIRPTPMENPILGLLAERLKQAQGFAAKPFGYSNPPAEMLMNLLGIPAVQQTMERMAYGEPLTTGRGMTTQVRPEVAEAALTVAPMAPAAGRAAKGVARMAGQEIADVMSGMPSRSLLGDITPKPMQLITYHGTPHKFTPTEKNLLGEFNASKIGTGEGAQAYGYGIYVAESPIVGKEYQRKLGNVSVMLGDTSIDDIIAKGGDAAKAAERLKKDFTNTSIAQHPDDVNSPTFWKETENYYKTVNNQETQGVKKLLDTYGSISASLKGNLYKADLPDEMIPKMLDWDRPLSEQKTIMSALRAEAEQKVRARMLADIENDIRSKLPKDENIGSDYMSLFNNANIVKNQEITDQAIAKLNSIDLKPLIDKEIKSFIPPDRTWEMTGKEYYEMLTNKLGSSKQASEMFANQGIPGIKYLDERSRNSTGQGTRNFVVFPGEEKNLRILERDGEKAPFQFPQQSALDTAQKNAALPISEGGLGLPPNNTPMDRAKAMGFDTPVYHATDVDFTSINPSVKGKYGAGVYTATTPRYAEIYAQGENARTLPLMARGKLASDDERIAIADQMLEQYQTKEGMDVPLWKNMTKEELANRGYTGVSIGKERLIFNPSDLRSHFAAFDPMRQNESDLLAGLLPASLLADPETRRKLDEELSLLYTK